MDKETSPWFWPTLLLRNEHGEITGGYLAPKEVLDALEQRILYGDPTCSDTPVGILGESPIKKPRSQ